MLLTVLLVLPSHWQANWILLGGFLSWHPFCRFELQLFRNMTFNCRDALSYDFDEGNSQSQRIWMR